MAKKQRYYRNPVIPADEQGKWAYVAQELDKIQFYSHQVSFDIGDEGDSTPGVDPVPEPGHEHWHDNLLNIGPNDHHNQVHLLYGSDHSDVDTTTLATQGGFLVYDTAKWKDSQDFIQLTTTGLDLKERDYLIDGEQLNRYSSRIGGEWYIVGDSLTAPMGGNDGAVTYDTDGSGNITNITVTTPGTGYDRDFWLAARDANGEGALFSATVTAAGAISSVSLVRQTGAFSVSLSGVSIPGVDNNDVASWAYLIQQQQADSTMWNVTIDALNGRSVARSTTSYPYNGVAASGSDGIALIMLGSNDAGGIDIGGGLAVGGGAAEITQAQFETALTTLVNAFQTDGWHVVLTLAPIPDLNQSNPDWDTAFALIRESQEKIAAAEGCELWDISTVILGDTLHPTQEGHRVLVRDMYPRMSTTSVAATPSYWTLSGTDIYNNNSGKVLMRTTVGSESSFPGNIEAAGTFRMFTNDGQQNLTLMHKTKDQTGLPGAAEGIARINFVGGTSTSTNAETTAARIAVEATSAWTGASTPAYMRFILNDGSGEQERFRIGENGNYYVNRTTQVVAINGLHMGTNLLMPAADSYNGTESSRLYFSDDDLGTGARWVGYINVSGTGILRMVTNPTYGPDIQIGPRGQSNIFYGSGNVQFGGYAGTGTRSLSVDPSGNLVVGTGTSGAFWSGISLNGIRNQYTTARVEIGVNGTGTTNRGLYVDGSSFYPRIVTSDSSTNKTGVIEHWYLTTRYCYYGFVLDKWKAQTNGAYAISFNPNDVEAARYTSSGEYHFGSTDQIGTDPSAFTIVGQSTTAATVSITRADNAYGPGRLIVQSADGTPSSPSALATGRRVGIIGWNGFDGTDFQAVFSQSVLTDGAFSGTAYDGSFNLNMATKAASVTTSWVPMTVGSAADNYWWRFSVDDTDTTEGEAGARPFHFINAHGTVPTVSGAGTIMLIQNNSLAGAPTGYSAGIGILSDSNSYGTLNFYDGDGLAGRMYYDHVTNTFTMYQADGELTGKSWSLGTADILELSRNTGQAQMVFSAPTGAQISFGDATSKTQGWLAWEHAAKRFKLSSASSPTFRLEFSAVPAAWDFSVGNNYLAIDDAVAATERVRWDDNGNMGLKDVPNTNMSAQVTSITHPGGEWWSYSAGSGNYQSGLFTNCTFDATNGFQYKEGTAQYAGTYRGISFASNNGMVWEWQGTTSTGNGGAAATMTKFMELDAGNGSTTLEVTGASYPGVYITDTANLGPGYELRGSGGASDKWNYQYVPSNRLRWLLNGSEKMCLTNSGELGLGTSSPKWGAHIEGHQLSVDGSGSQGVIRAGRTDTNPVNGTELGRLAFHSYNSTGTVARNVGRIHVVTTENHTDAAAGGEMYFATAANGAGAVTNHMRLKEDGEFICGGITDNGAYNLQCNGTGVWGQGAYVNGSDERWKSDISDIVTGLDTVMALRPVTYTYNELSGARDTESRHAGFIAQEVEELDIVDGLVETNDEGYKSMAYQELIPVLVKAIQELKAEIEELKNA